MQSRTPVENAVMARHRPSKTTMKSKCMKISQQLLLRIITKSEGEGEGEVAGQERRGTRNRQK